MCKDVDIFQLFTLGLHAVPKNLDLFSNCVQGDRKTVPRKKWNEIKSKQAQRRAEADRSRHKSHGRIQYQGPYFPTECLKWIAIISIVLVGKNMLK